MNDNDIFALIISVLQPAFAVEEPTLVIRQRYQPTLQGVPTEPTIFLHKVAPYRYGHQYSKSVYNEVDGDFDTTESAWRMPTFQLSALSLRDPSDVSKLTASDICEIAADILQSKATRKTLLDSGVGIQRISTIRQIFFKNDRDQFEAEPSFDFTLSYVKVISTTKTPAVTSISEADSKIVGV